RPLIPREVRQDLQRSVKRQIGFEQSSQLLSQNCEIGSWKAPGDTQAESERTPLAGALFDGVDRQQRLLRAATRLPRQHPGHRALPIILWNTRYLERAIAALRQAEDVPDQLL